MSVTDDILKSNSSVHS